MRRYINKGGFMTSRINWAIQSSGVDYLHLLIISMDYLIRRFNIDARLAITVHDEIRYIVKEQDKYRGAMALQVANVWTRAMFSQQMGINDLPQSCAYFSAVDIDHVLRKEVDMDCVTPSHPGKIPHGESVTINQLLDKGSAAYLDPNIVPNDPINLEQYPYTPRPSVMAELRERTDLNFLKAQISSEPKELNDIIKDINKKSSPTGLSSTEKGLPKTKVRKMKTTPPSYPHPQEPRLMDAPYGYEEVNPFWNELGNTNYGKPWIRTQLPARGSLLNDGPR